MARLYKPWSSETTRAYRVSTMHFSCKRVLTVFVYNRGYTWNDQCRDCGGGTVHQENRDHLAMWYQEVAYHKDYRLHFPKGRRTDVGQSKAANIPNEIGP